MKNTSLQGRKGEVGGVNTSHKHTWASMCQAAMKTHFAQVCAHARAQIHTRTLLYGAL